MRARFLIRETFSLLVFVCVFHSKNFEYQDKAWQSQSIELIKSTQNKKFLHKHRIFSCNMRGDKSISGMDEKFCREGEEKLELPFQFCLSLGREASGVMKDKMDRKFGSDCRGDFCLAYCLGE